jgi:hypothetical protein
MQGAYASASEKIPTPGNFFGYDWGIRGTILTYALAAASTAWGLFPAFLGSTEIRMVEKKAPKRGRRSPVGDRRQFLTMMSPSVIKAVKQAGLDDDRPAWDIMEEAAKQWLERRKGKRSD